MAALEEENRQVLNLLQALLGAISPNFRAVTIAFSDSIVLTFLLSHESAQDRKEVEEIAFEFLALQSSLLFVSSKVIVSDKPLIEIELPGRLVYLRREAV